MRTLLRCTIRQCTSRRVTPTHWFCRYVSRKSIASPDAKEQQVLNGRLNHIRFSIKRLLSHRREDAAKQYLLKQMESPTFSRNARLAAYEAAIPLFLKHELFTAAHDLYEKMQKDGLYPTSCLRAMMASIPIVQNVHGHKALFDTLVPLLELESFNEADLRRLLDFLQTLHVPSKVLTRLVEHYAATRKPGHDLEIATVNKVIALYTREGSLKAAAQRMDATARDASPFTTLLSELAAAGARTPAATDAILARMEHHGVVPDLALFNTLIAGAVRTQDFYTAFALYARLHAQAELVPDAFTFGSLFKALQVLAQVRGPRSRRARVPENVRPPRVLFCDMLASHLLNHAAARTSTLNVAMRTFMDLSDYSAAFVALHAYTALKLKPDIKTFRVVVVTLLSQVRADLYMRGPEEGGNVRWVDQFLGPEVAARLKPSDIGDDMIDHLLRFGTILVPGVTPQDLEEKETGGKSKEKGKGKVPSLPMMLGEVEPSKNTKWDTAPLERLLRKAMLARMEDIQCSEDEAVFAAVKEAQAEMLPKVGPRVLEALEKLLEKQTQEKKGDA